jgi:hypothetical protein
MSTDDQPIPAAPATRKLDEAQEQADEYGGDFRSATITTKSGKKFTVPSVVLLDDDQLIAYEKLHHELNQCDRYPDIQQPSQRFVSKNADGTEVITEVSAHTVRGDFIQPYQKDGVLIEPPYSIQLAHIFWGEEGYAKFKAAGGHSAEIPTKLLELNAALADRKAADSKSADGAVVLDEVPEGDPS